MVRLCVIDPLLNGLFTSSCRKKARKGKQLRKDWTERNLTDEIRLNKERKEEKGENQDQKWRKLRKENPQRQMKLPAAPSASCLKPDRDVSWWNPSCYRRQTAELALASAARLLILTWIINSTHSSLFRPAVDSLHYGGCVYITECIVCQKLPAYEPLDGGKREREREREAERERTGDGQEWQQGALAWRVVISEPDIRQKERDRVARERGILTGNFKLHIRSQTQNVKSGRLSENQFK